MKEVGILCTRVPLEIVFFREVGGFSRMGLALREYMRVCCQIGGEIEHWLVPVGSGTEGVGASLRG